MLIQARKLLCFEVLPMLTREYGAEFILLIIQLGFNLLFPPSPFMTFSRSLTI